MVSWRRLGLYLLVTYTLIEIVVDNVLVFMNLTGRSIPSLTPVVLGLVGIDVGAPTGSTWGSNAPIILFGVLGVAFMFAAVWQLATG